MPWTVGDVDRHKKGLTTEQKKKWVSIANGVLKQCQEEGGSDCEGKAIRIANSKFSMEEVMEKLNLPKGAMRLVAHGCHANLLEAADGESEKMAMTVYSGGLIEGHWYWGRLGIDLKGIKFDRDKYPILENHDTDRKIGFSKRPTVEGALKLSPDSVSFVDTEASREFRKTAKEGFPFQASMYAIPKRIEWVEEGATSEFNGLSLSGPGAIWRECLFQESSVCVFGWDSKTQSTAFSKEVTDEVEVESIRFKKGGKEGGDKMDLTLEKLKADFPELVTKLSEEVKAAMKAEFDVEKDKLTGQITGLTSNLDAANTKILELEKKDILRDERERKLEADRIWAEKLAVSQIREDLYEKIMQHVSAAKFVKDGVFDKEAFGKAVDEEIADWEKRGAVQAVKGMSFSKKTETGDDESQLDKQDDEVADSLLSMVGQKKN